MITKKIIAPLLAMILIAGIGGVLSAKKMTDQRAAKGLEVSATQTADQSAPSDESAPAGNTAPASAKGRYIEYSSSAASDNSYANTVLFFHAGWCPECRSFKQAITNGEIPGGTQVLEVNYDTSADLKKQHGVTLQSTFVKVDSSGKQISKWVGYGKDKSLQAVLNNL